MPTDKERIDKLEVDMVNVKTRLAVAESNLEEMIRRLENINNNTVWLIRLILSALIVAVLELVLKGGVKL